MTLGPYRIKVRRTAGTRLFGCERFRIVNTDSSFAAPSGHPTPHLHSGAWICCNLWPGRFGVYLEVGVIRPVTLYL